MKLPLINLDENRTPIRAIIRGTTYIATHMITKDEEKNESFKEGKHEYDIKPDKFFIKKNWLGLPKYRCQFYDEGEGEPIGLESPDPSDLTAEEIKIMKYESITAAGIRSFIQRKISLPPKMVIFIIIFVAVAVIVAMKLGGKL